MTPAEGPVVDSTGLAGLIRSAAWQTFQDALFESGPLLVKAAIDARLHNALLDDFEEHRAEAYWLLESELEKLKTAVGATLAGLEELRVDDVRANGAIRLGDTAYTIGPDNTRKLLVPIEDFLEWLDIQRWPLDQIFSLSERTVRITAFRTWAERSYREYLESDAEHHRILDPEGHVIQEELDRLTAEYVQTIEDTFFEKVEKDSAAGRWKLNALPLTKAQWAQPLEHGQRRPRKAAK